MQAVIERHVTAGPELKEKLAASRAGTVGVQLRTIRCPSCGFYLLDVYGREHYYIRVKCRKCKFDETIDTALFRTIHRSRDRRIARAKERDMSGWNGHTSVSTLNPITHP